MGGRAVVDILITWGTGGFDGAVGAITEENE